MSESDHDTAIIEIFVDVFPRFAIVTVTHKEGPLMLSHFSDGV